MSNEISQVNHRWSEMSTFFKYSIIEGVWEQFPNKSCYKLYITGGELVGILHIKQNLGNIIEAYYNVNPKFYMELTGICQEQDLKLSGTKLSHTEFIKICSFRNISEEFSKEIIDSCIYQLQIEELSKDPIFIPIVFIILYPSSRFEAIIYFEETTSPVLLLD